MLHLSSTERDRMLLLGPVETGQLFLIFFFVCVIGNEILIHFLGLAAADSNTKTSLHSVST